MSRLLSCNALVDHALREIGSFSPYDVSADQAQHEIGLERLDLLIAELAGTENLWFLRPSRQTVSVPISVRSFSLAGRLSPALQFFSDVRITFPEAPEVERALTLMRRSVYDAIENKDDTGDPRVIVIDRDDSPSCAIYPTANRTGISLVIDGQAYAATAMDNLGKNASGFPAAWQRYLIKTLAIDLGSGPITTIPPDERQQKQGEAAQSKSLLLSRNNRENIKRPRIVRPWDPTCRAGNDSRPRRDYGER